VERPAQTDADRIYEHIAAGAPDAAVRWYEGLFAEIGALDQMPYRFEAHQLDAVIRVGLRRFVYGQYLVFYTVSDLTRSVHVLHVRHGARKRLTKLDGL
jgi:plasmid stabilization system protein ParE